MKIKDNSSDKKYFTIIPNYILNHSSAVDQALYLQMKRIAGEGGECSASVRYFQKQLNVGIKSIKKSIQYLIDHEWIDFVGKKESETRGGKQGINTYVVNDLWKKNIDYYDKGVPESTHLDDKGVSKGTHLDPKVYPEEHIGVSKRTHLSPKGVSRSNYKEEQRKRKNIEPFATQGVAEANTSDSKGGSSLIASPLPATPELIPDLLLDKKKHVQIIGVFAKFKGISFDSKEHQREFIKRNTRAAVGLVPYPNERIIQVMAWLEQNADFKWTVESIGKYIDEDLTKLKTQQHSIAVG